MKSGSSLWWAALCLLVFLVCGIRFATLNPVHGWADDGAAYLQHAKNVLEGKSYNDTKFGATELNRLPAVAYPPGVPLLLAAEIPVTGIDFRIFKMSMLLIYGLALLATGVALRDLYGGAVALSTVAVLAISYELGRMADHINNDFLALFFLALLLIWERRDSRSWLSHLVTAALLLALYETRPVTVVILPALVFHRWRMRGWPIRDIAIGLATATVVLIAGWWPMHKFPSYVNLLQALLTKDTLRRNFIQYPLALGLLAERGMLVALALDAAAILGIYKLVRSGSRDLWLLFSILYIPVILLWPFSDPIRFLIPILPLLVGAALSALHSNKSWGNAVMALLVLAFGTTQLGAYRALPDEFRSGMNHPSTLELYSAIRTKLPETAVIASRKPRSMVLMTGYRGLIYPSARPRELAAALCNAGTTHVVFAPSVFEDDAKYLAPMLNSGAVPVEQVFRNDQFSMYALRGCGDMAAKDATARVLP